MVMVMVMMMGMVMVMVMMMVMMMMAMVMVMMMVTVIVMVRMTMRMMMTMMTRMMLMMVRMFCFRTSELARPRLPTPQRGAGDLNPGQQPGEISRPTLNRRSTFRRKLRRSSELALFSLLRKPPPLLRPA